MAVDYEEGRRLLAEVQTAENAAGPGKPVWAKWSKGLAESELADFLLTHAEALLNPVSAAPSPAGDEVERVARALLREEIESYRESDVLLDEHIQWWKDGNDNPESCVHYSSIGLAMRRARAAISALRPAPKLSEDEAVVERLADVIADAMNMNRAGRLEHEAALAVLRTLAGKE